MRKQVLVITSREDPHVDFMEPRFQNRNIDIVRVDTDTLFQGNTATAEVSSRGEPSLHLYGKEISPFSVWYRKPTASLLKEDFAPDVTKFIARETDLFWQCVFGALRNARWVNHPFELSRAGIKFIQLQEAHRVGFNVPRTLFTTDPVSALLFCESVNWLVVAKTLGAPLVEVEGDLYNTYARALDRSKKDQLQYLKNCPTILQELVVKKREVRATVFGDRVFSIEISVKGGATDWREVDEEDTLYHDIMLPEQVNRRCIELVKRFGLLFSTMDLVEDVNGQWFFLDLNPNGQWLWVQGVSEQDLVGPFIELLTSNSFV